MKRRLLHKIFELPVVVPYIDTYSSAKVVYSLNKLRTAYAGSAIRIRRESDNAEIDIGFTASGHLNQNAIISFVAGSNGRVTKIYDQSGNGIDAFQTLSNDYQPYIFKNGQICKIKRYPAILFSDTGVANIKFINVPVFSFTYISMFSANYLLTNDNNARVFSCSPTGISDFANNVKSFSFGEQTLSSDNRNINASQAAQLKNTMLIHRNHVTATQAINTRNNVTVTDNSITPSICNTDFMSIGNEGNQNLSTRFRVGYMLELVIYDFDNTANDVAIKTYLEDYYLKLT